jgi:hypothetical protein
LAPIPKKTTKKGNSTEEVNASRLFFEHLVYHNQVQDLQGQFIPNLPTYKGPPGKGETEGESDCRKEACLEFYRF